MKGILKIYNGDWYVVHRYLTKTDLRTIKGRDMNLHQEELLVHPPSIVESGLTPKEDLYVCFQRIKVGEKARAKIIM